MVDRTQPPARPWYVVGRPWAREETYAVGGEPRGSGPNGDPHIYDPVIAVPVWCADCEDPQREDHTPETHRAALRWAVHCVNQHDAATQLLARAYTTLQDLEDLDDLVDGEIGELVDALRDWLEDEPAGPIPDATPLDDEQTSLAELLDMPDDQHMGTCRCGGEVWYSPRDDVSWCSNGCPGGPDLIDQEALP